MAVSSLIDEQKELEAKIRNCYSNMMKKGRSNLTIGIIDSRLSNMEEHWHMYSENDKQLRKQKTKRDSKLDYFANDEHGKLEEFYLDSKGSFLDEKSRFAHPVTTSAHQLSAEIGAQGSLAVNPMPQRKMPVIAIPKFNGKLNEWTSYRDLFKALVVEQPLNNIEKFSHLRASLSGDPFILIKNVPVKENNFEAAWEKLVNHYDNNKSIIYSHVNDLISIKPMSAESVIELRRVLNDTIDAVVSLEALDGHFQHWDWFLVPLTSNRLDHASRRDWETLTANKSEPVAFSELKKFMQERLLTLELLPAANSQEKEVKKDKIQGRKIDYNSSKNVKVHNLTKNSYQNNSKSSVTDINKNCESKNCIVCSKPHFIAYCYVFKGKSSNDKLELVRANKLCYNCLGQHHVKDCRTQKTCLICAARHHTLLHDGLQSPAVISNPEKDSQASSQEHVTNIRNPAVLVTYKLKFSTDL